MPRASQHGTVHHYRKYGCRCDLCSSAYTDGLKRWAKSVKPGREASKRLASKRRAYLHKLKSVPCMDCGVTYPPFVMDFDHRPDEVKLFNVSEKMSRKWADILAEIAKCDVVCANCHRIRTNARLVDCMEVLLHD